MRPSPFDSQSSEPALHASHIGADRQAPAFLPVFRLPDFFHACDRQVQADLLDLCRLVTTYVCKEHFCEGHLPALANCGHITRVLQRLEAIRRSEEVSTES